MFGKRKNNIEPIVGEITDDSKRDEDSNWPADDPKGFFFIAEKNDTEIDGGSIPVDNIYPGLTDYTQRIAKNCVPPLITQIYNDFQTKTVYELMKSGEKKNKPVFGGIGDLKKMLPKAKPAPKAKGKPAAVKN